MDIPISEAANYLSKLQLIHLLTISVNIWMKKSRQYL
jgi:hypothetical protein